MNPWLRRIVIALAVIAVIVGAAYYWFFVDGGTQTAAYTIDMAEVRRLADTVPGAKAVEIRDEHVAPFAFRRAIVVAGDGWDPLPMAVFAYRIMFDHSSVIVDTGVSPRGAQDMGTQIDMDSYRRVRSALKYASTIVVTHEHADHIGGLLASPWLELELAHTKLNAEQLANLDRFNSDYRREGFASYKPIVYDKYLAIAPGVVLIRAPGHTPGSQMVYVKMADRREYLFIGDVAWTMRNIDLIRERPRATAMALGEDRGAVLSELAALNALQKAEPHLHIVPGHDLEAVTTLEKQGLLVHGFSTPIGPGSYAF